MECILRPALSMLSAAPDVEPERGNNILETYLAVETQAFGR